jgi:hypothetical protein
MSTPPIDLDRLLKLRLVVARFGEMDIAKWWNTKGQLGRLGTAALRRGFPRTHRFAQAVILPSGINERLTGLDRAGIDRDLISIQTQIDDLAFTLYEITAEDRAAIETASKRVASAARESDAADDDDGDDPSEDGVAVSGTADAVTWVEGEGGKWTARKAPTRSIDKLVRERTSPAVKSALKILLEAPGVAGAAKKTKKGKASA